MSAAARAEHFYAQTAVAVILPCLQSLVLGRRPEAWPPGARLEFGLRAEQFRVAADAPITSRLFGFPEFAFKRRFRFSLSGHAVLLSRQQLFPLRIGFDDRRLVFVFVAFCRSRQRCLVG